MTMRAPCYLAGFFLLAGTSLTADPPRLDRVIPQALAPGGTTSLQLVGPGVEKVTSVWTSFPASVMIMQTGKVEVTVRGEVPPQLGAIRVIGPGGASNLMPVLLDPLVTQLPAGEVTGETPEAAVELQVGQAAEGHVEGESSWYCQLKPTRGERVTIDIWARRMGSQLDPVLKVTDASGSEVGFSDDEPGLAGDCRVSFLAESDEPLLLQIQDARFRGGGDFFFRVRTGRSLNATGVYPPVVQYGSDSTVVPFPADGEVGSLAIPFQADKQGLLQWVAAKQQPALIAPVQLSARREWHEPADQGPGEKIAVKVGDAVSGWFASEGEADRFAIQLDKPMRLRMTAATRTFGSAALLWLAVQDEQGNTLAEARPNDELVQALEVDLPEAGTYQLVVRELLRRHGREFIYRVTLDEKVPRFELDIESDVYNAAPGGTVEMKVTARRQGYDGPISLAVEAPQSVSLENAVIPSGKGEAVIQLKLPAQWKPTSFHQLRIVGQGIGEEYETLAQQDALKYARGNLGKYDGFVSDNQTAVTNFAEYEMDVLEAGMYQLRLRYAALQSRPARLLINDQLVREDGMKETSGGWVEENQRWHLEGVYAFKAGKNVVRIERDGTVSHLSQLRIARPSDKSEIHPALTQQADVSAALRKKLGGTWQVPRNLAAEITIGVTGVSE